ncbi:MAG: bifunctional diaminohydroxyphosphoribosylaminopyrimidine deaminase/5-amino-6-(5-phosphoribosylamino)uracil reductase RibD [Bacteroidota bacterium]
MSKSAYFCYFAGMSDEFYMQRCFQLAIQGVSYAMPNPLVGAVIVHNDRIIGEGYHRKYGFAHAEVNAVAAVKDPSLLTASTIYVSLEPCAHFGKTPPCADLIIQSGIPKVVISCTDTFSQVAGKGIERLKAAGVEVVTGVLEQEGRQLNRRFFTFHEKKRPYVVLKWARTTDGYLDMDRSAGETGVKWITDRYSRQLVHAWRSEEAGILVGKNTWVTDSPGLDVRLIAGKNPEKFVLTSSGDAEFPGDVTALKGSIPEVLEQCYRKGIQSIFVEGGAATLQSFIDSGLWDEARVLTGRTTFGSGTPAPLLTGFDSEQIGLPGGDLLHNSFNRA